MNLKLDENLGVRGADVLRAAGHDVATVVEQELTSATDVELIEACREERRALVTLDLDFSNPLRFDPALYAGIAVLRLPRRPSRADLMATIETLVNGLAQAEIAGRLWIVEQGRLRTYQPLSD